MKTSQDFNENFNQYSSEIEKEMSNLNRMLQEFASNGVVAQQIINDLEPVLAKLHLTIDSFTMNRPDKRKPLIVVGSVFTSCLTGSSSSFSSVAILHVVLVRTKAVSTVKPKRFVKRYRLLFRTLSTNFAVQSTRSASK